MPRRGAIARVVTIAACCGGAFRVAQMQGLRINLSPSVPIGLYVAEGVGLAARGEIARGSLVEVCLPRELASFGYGRGYLGRGSCADGVAPVGKPVFAVGGDTVIISDSGIGVRGRVLVNTRPLARDAKGRDLTHVVAGRYVVGRDEAWLVSSYTPNSWDSRYYGPVALRQVSAVLRPVCLW